MGNQVSENDVMQQLLAKMQDPSAPKELCAAYVAAWGELGVGVKKDANNPHFGNDYATLEAYLTVVKPVFARHQLAILQSPGEIEGDRIAIETLLVHASGQMLKIKTHMPLGGKSTAQTAGSATTYGRRYVVAALGGLAPSDDDGEAASQAPTEKHPKSKPAKSAAAPAAASYADGVEALLAEIEAFAGSADDLEKTIRPRVEELGDQKVNEAYVARRRTLRSKK